MALAVKELQGVYISGMTQPYVYGSRLTAALIEPHSFSTTARPLPSGAEDGGPGGYMLLRGAPSVPDCL